MSLERIEPYPLRKPLTSLAGRYIFQTLNGNVAAGQLAVNLSRREQALFKGVSPGPAADLCIERPLHLALRVLTRGDIGFAESFIAGEWRSRDLASLLELLLLNEEYLSARKQGNALARLARRLKHGIRANTRSGSRRNITQHYDLGNDFYRLWLDAGMTYSCALFANAQESLEAAQARKYERMLDLLRPHADQHILEIGCGWGGFALAAARCGLRVTGITLSARQLALARQRVAEAGLEHRIELRLQDYRELTGQFDHVVSIEMLEAVGETYWPVYFNTLARCLKPGGRVALQCITIDDAFYPVYRASPDFIQLYVFPGGMLPTPRLIAEQAARAGFRLRKQAFIGTHYATTVEHWRRSVVENSAQIHALGYDERFLRLWLYYLAYCTAGFKTGRVDLMQAALEPAVAR